MANHKRRKPKNSRSGCLMCKYWKINGFSPKEKMKFSEYRRYSDAAEQMKDV